MWHGMSRKSHPAHVFFTSLLNPCPFFHYIWFGNPFTVQWLPFSHGIIDREPPFVSNPPLCHSRANVDPIIIISIFPSDLAKRFVSHISRTQKYHLKLQPNRVHFNTYHLNCLLFSFILSTDMESEESVSAVLLSFSESCISYFLESLHVFLTRCETPTALEEPQFCDMKRGEGSSCLWHGSDVLICDPEANEQMLHYALCALPGL